MLEAGRKRAPWAVETVVAPLASAASAAASAALGAAQTPHYVAMTPFNAEGGGGHGDDAGACIEREEEVEAALVALCRIAVSVATMHKTWTRQGSPPAMGLLQFLVRGSVFARSGLDAFFEHADNGAGAGGGGGHGHGGGGVDDGRWFSRSALRAPAVCLEAWKRLDHRTATRDAHAAIVGGALHADSSAAPEPLRAAAEAAAAAAAKEETGTANATTTTRRRRRRRSAVAAVSRGNLAEALETCFHVLQSGQYLATLVPALQRCQEESAAVAAAAVSPTTTAGAAPRCRYRSACPSYRFAESALFAARVVALDASRRALLLAAAPAAVAAAAARQPPPLPPRRPCAGCC